MLSALPWQRINRRAGAGLRRLHRQPAPPALLGRCAATGRARGPEGRGEAAELPAAAGGAAAEVLELGLTAETGARRMEKSNLRAAAGLPHTALRSARLQRRPGFLSLPCWPPLCFPQSRLAPGSFRHPSQAPARREEADSLRTGRQTGSVGEGIAIGYSPRAALALPMLVVKQ